MEHLVPLFVFLKRIQKAMVSKSSTAQAGEIPISDGNGGYSWGAAVTNTISAQDQNNDGNVEFIFTEV